MKISMLAVAFITIGVPARAEFSTGGSFAAPGYGARAWGMAGAAIALGIDEGAVYWNPALMSVLDQNRLGLSYVDLIAGADAQQSYLSYAHRLKAGEAEAPGLEFTKHSVGVLYGNLGLTLSDGQSYSENMLRLAYAYSPRYFVSIGVGLGLLFSSSDIESFGATGTAIDVGIRVALLRDLTFGMVVRNAMSQLDFDDGVNLSLQRSYTAGLGYEIIENVNVEADVVTTQGSVSRFALGGEAALFSDLLFVRGGISTMNAGESRSIPHVGLGLQWERYRVDYNANFDSEDAFENTHRFSLGVGL